MKIASSKQHHALNVNDLNKSHSIDKWHWKLGHASFDSLSYIFDIVMESTSQLCETCPCVKIHTTSFNKSVTKSTAIFQLWHIDAWGPY